LYFSVFFLKLQITGLIYRLNSEYFFISKNKGFSINKNPVCYSNFIGQYAVYLSMVCNGNFSLLKNELVLFKGKPNY